MAEFRTFVLGSASKSLSSLDSPSPSSKGRTVEKKIALIFSSAFLQLPACLLFSEDITPSSSMALQQAGTSTAQGKAMRKTCLGSVCECV